MTNNQIKALCNDDLSYTMRVFLDNRKGKDLIQSAYEFRQYFSLSQDRASELIQVWIDLNEVV